MKYTLVIAALLGSISAVKMQHHHKHHHQHRATPLSNFHPQPRNNWESADIDADNSRASNDIPEHCIHNVAGHCGITSSKQVAQPTTYGPQHQDTGKAAYYPVNNMIAQISSGATPLSNFHPWPRNNFEAADIDADNSRASNDIPEHCIHNVAGHCGITSSKQVAQPTTYGPQHQDTGKAAYYPVNNMIVQTEATPLSNFHPWPRNNFEAADIDADNSRASNDIPEHCIHNVAGHCGITSSKQVAQPTTYGPQHQDTGKAAYYPVNNMIVQTEATPLSNFHPWPRNNFEAADIDADNSRASNDIPEHCIHNVAGHCGITSSKQVAQPTTYGPQHQDTGKAAYYPVNNMIVQTEMEGGPNTGAAGEPRYVMPKYAGLKGFNINTLEHCPDFNERMTLLNGKTKAVAYPAAGFNCNADYGM